MDRETRIDVNADVIIRHRATTKEETLTLHGIECVWHWDDSTRDAAEYWSVADYISQTFGSSIDWFSIKAWSGSPRKDTPYKYTVDKSVDPDLAGVGGKLVMVFEDGSSVEVTPEQVREAGQ